MARQPPRAATSRRTTALAGVAAAAAATAAALAAGRIGASAALSLKYPAGFTGPPVTVRRVDDATVGLTRTAESTLPGCYGLTDGDVHAVIGPETADSPAGARTVERQLAQVTGAPLRPGRKLRVTPQIHVGTPGTALGLAYEDLTVLGELGPLPAWYVPGARDTWVLTAHGLGATREQALCVLPFLRKLDLPVLVLTHRGDPGAPRTADGSGRLGRAEWVDLDAALRHAVGHGARRVVLYGWSSGAVMALRTAAASPLKARISGLVLDSPVLDWRATVAALAVARGLPAPLRRLAVLAAEERTGLGSTPDGNDLWPGPGAPQTLLVHGPDDTVAPWEASRALAAAHPDRIHLYPVPYARHAAMWNADPVGYEEALRRFLTPLL
ncbi:hypothetical protein AB0M28_21740 [Streptomyces sp. NPDC051940]|uniref:alpha/beta hydrolase n=1 Tax=Streptomyces sp. NPDC051940 TaxID=3155675 RepID=UPI00341A739E